MAGKKSVIIGIVIVVIAVGAYIFILNADSQGAAEETATPTQPEIGATQTTEETTANQTATVQYTDTGYSPTTLEVPLGTTVTFTNQSSKQMWTASDPHPVHTAYRQLDAKRGMKTGESYSFTFDRSGEWGYHNHLVPGDTGTVRVK